MIDIKLENIGKKFRNEWIFKNLDYHFKTGAKYAITGHNGSGKSTFLSVISGIIPANKGNITYAQNGVNVAEDQMYKLVSFTAPYIELIEEFTLTELISFHTSFKPFIAEMDSQKFLEKTYLSEHQHKPIKQFSSGMKQRLKLGLSFFTESSILFLDEPTTNLDELGIQWYLSNVRELAPDRLVIISSNDKREFEFCDETLDITKYK